MRNIEVYIKPPRVNRVELMKQCSILLSTQQDEAFGMVVVEAMSMGCIPVVYRDGGPWTDILEEKDGIIGSSYENTLEAQEKIEQILGDGELRAEMRENSVKRSREFSAEVFEEKITRTIKEYQPLHQDDNFTKIYRWIKKMGEIKARLSRG